MLRKISILIMGAVAAAFAGCDEVAAPDRYIELPPVESARVVLIEEFTGQLCVNCPDAHKVIEELCVQYPDNLISVSIHAGGKAFCIMEGAMSAMVGLGVPDGDAYGTAAGVNKLPEGIINRTSGLQTMDQWAATVRSELSRPACLDIDLKAYCDDGKIVVSSTLSPHANIMGHLQLWVVESGIVAPQRMPSNKFDTQYVHNHVFRAAINGTEGTPIDILINETYSYANSIEIKDNWDLDNVEIVGFVYTDRGVEQAIKVPLTEKP